MAQNLTDLLKLSKAQMSKLGKTELVDILMQTGKKESTVKIWLH